VNFRPNPHNPTTIKKQKTKNKKHTHTHTHTQDNKEKVNRMKNSEIERILSITLLFVRIRNILPLLDLSSGKTAQFRGH